MLGRCAGHQTPATGAALRSEINHPVGLGPDVKIVLHHHQRVASIDQPMQYANQLLDISHVQADGGFIEHIKRVRSGGYRRPRCQRLRPGASNPRIVDVGERANLGKLGDQFDALRLATR